MRILHLTRDLPPAGKGGISTAVAGLLRASVAAGNIVAAISFDGWRPRSRPGMAAAARRDDGSGFELLRAYGPQDLDAAAAFARRFQPSLLHAHDPLVWQALAGRLDALSAPMLLTVHVAQAHMARLRGLQALTMSQRAEAKALQAARLIVVPSQCTAALLLAEQPALAARVRVVGNGIARPASVQAAAAGADSRVSRVVLYAGRFDPLKGTDVLLRAMEAIRRRHADVTLMLAGGLPGNARSERRWRRRWQERATEHEQAAVQWAGWLNPDALVVWRERAALLVVPSRFETFGLSALEGMAAGMAVVASDCGGLAELIEDGVTGVLVPPGDEEALISAIGDLLDDPERRARLGRAAMEGVRERWTWQHILPAMEAVWREGCGG